MEQIKIWIKEQGKRKYFKILMFVTVFVMIGLGIEFYLFRYSFFKIIRYLSLVFSLSIIAWIDGNSKRIPNKLLIALMIFRSIYMVVECFFFSEIWMTLLITFLGGAIIAGGLFLFCYLVTRGAVGAGDVKLFTVVGYYLGSGVIFTAVFMSVVLSALYSMLQLILKKKGLKEEIPFAPFVYAGTLLTMVLGM